jgi:hypothetical protein
MQLFEKNYHIILIFLFSVNLAPYIGSPMATCSAQMAMCSDAILLTFVHVNVCPHLPYGIHKAAAPKLRD